jgi:chemotaxis protein histidine kinase CheA
MNKYTRLFIDESRVYVPGIAAILGRLRAGYPEEFDIREGQRLSHSMKGMALFEQQTCIAALTEAMERGFERLSGDGADGALVAGLEAAVPVLARMIDEVEGSGATRADPDGIVAAIEAALRGAPTGSEDRR